MAVQVHLKDKTVLYYTCRVLRLKSFSDVDESVSGVREIGFLGTLGVFQDTSPTDRRFFPDKFVDKGFMAQLLVQSNEDFILSEVTEDLYMDVLKDDPLAPYVQVAIQNGLMAGNIDGTFTPDAPLKGSDIADLLFQAGIINFKTLGGDPSRFITRKELAVILAYLPEYQEQIQDLIDWESGYYLDL